MGVLFLMSRKKEYTTFFVSLLTGLLFISDARADPNHHGHDEEAEKKDIQVEFSARPHSGIPDDASLLKSGEAVKIGFQISEKNVSEGLSNLHPAAWLIRRGRDQKKPDSAQCGRNVRRLLRRGVLQEPEMSLNGYKLITLNSDNSIGIYNPLVSLASSNLMALIPLKTPAASWIFDQPSARIYVSLPKENQVAVVDLHRRKLARMIPVGEQPTAIWEQAGSAIFVGNEGSGTVSVIDRNTQEVIKTIDVGPGPLTFASDENHQSLYIASGGNGNIIAYDTTDGTLKIKARVFLGQGDFLMAYSAISKMLYVSDKETGNLTILSGSDLKVVKKLRMSGNVTSLGTSRDGRFLLVLHQKGNLLEVLSTETNERSHVLSTPDHPDYLEFSPLFAYIRNRGQGNVSILQTSALKNVEAPPFAHIPMGQAISTEIPTRPGVSPIAILPNGGGALVASPSDKTIYYYMETGMMAPSNSFKTYTAIPLGLFIYDHSLVERETPGYYETATRFEYGGVYDVHFLLSNPKTVLCFELRVSGPAAPEVVKLKLPVLKNLFESESYAPGMVSRLRFKLEDPESREALSKIQDLRVLGFLQSSGWQKRAWTSSLGEGIYEVELTFPKAGRYHILLESRSLGIQFGDLKPSFVRVSEKKLIH